MEQKKPANWIKSFTQNGITYSMSEKGAVKITSPDGKTICILSNFAVKLLAQHTDGLASFVNDVVVPYDETLAQVKQDAAIAQKAQREVARTVANLDTLAKTNPEFLKALLAKIG